MLLVQLMANRHLIIIAGFTPLSSAWLGSHHINDLISQGRLRR